VWRLVLLKSISRFWNTENIKFCDALDYLIFLHAFEIIKLLQSQTIAEQLY